MLPLMESNFLLLNHKSTTADELTTNSAPSRTECAGEFPHDMTGYNISHIAS